MCKGRLFFKHIIGFKVIPSSQGKNSEIKWMTLYCYACSLLRAVILQTILSDTVNLPFTNKNFLTSPGAHLAFISTIFFYVFVIYNKNDQLRVWQQCCSGDIRNILTASKYLLGFALKPWHSSTQKQQNIVRQRKPVYTAYSSQI